jgi:AcrR family transcriptional regulator
MICTKDGHMTRTSAKKPDTRKTLLLAAKKVLRRDGYSGLSTREVAETAGVPLSQIHYHFGSKTGLVLALFEHQNNELLSRQRAMFDDTSIPLSARWDRACDYLDEDIASGYVRTLQELLAASWSDPEIAKTVQAAQLGWHSFLTEMAERVSDEIGGLGPFAPKELASLVANAFIGAESMFLLGVEKLGIPVRDCLRRVGDLIRILEQQRT